MALIRLLTLVALLGGEVHEGWAPHYAQGLMGRVARNRDLAPAGCMVSSPRYDIGTWVYVYGKRTGALRFCQVVDVSGPQDRARHLRTGREVEIAFESTIDFCGTTLSKPTDCPVLVIRIDE